MQEIINERKIQLNSHEMSIYILAYDYFKALQRKIGPNPYTYGFLKVKDPRKYKYWEVFVKFYEIVKNDSHFNMYWFVEAQFIDGLKRFNPRQILTKAALERYFEYLKNKQAVLKGSELDDIITLLDNDYKTISEWKQRSGKGIYHFFNEITPGSVISDGIYYVMMRFISPYFLSVSKSFWRAYKSLDIDVKKELYTENELKIARGRLYASEILKEKVKALFGKEVII